MSVASYQATGAYAAGLLLTLFLAAWLTPRRWWRRPNAVALLILAAGTWGLGGLLLRLAPASPATAAVPAPLALPAKVAVPAAAPPVAGLPFQTHRALNLREVAGVQGPRVLTVPPGASVTPTGERSGDWWRVRARVAGAERLGWVNSLWLRRGGE